MEKEMEMEMDFDFDNLEMDFDHKHETSILLYAEGEFGEKGELIQRLVAEHLINIQIDYVNKKFHAQYSGEEIYGIKNGEIFDISFYQMIIV